MKKCPYCAEEIQDEARVCRYCGRELSPDTEHIPPPINENSPHSEAQTGSSAPSTASPSWGQIILALLIPALLGIAVNAYLGSILTPPFFRPTESQVSTYYFLWWVWLVSFVPCGFWAGVAWPGRSLKGYVLLGVSEAFLGLVVDLISEPTQGANVFGFFAPGLVFLSGALFADLRKKRASPPGTRGSGYARAIARGISGPGKAPNEQTVEFIEKLGPALIGLVGTVITVAFK